MSIFGKHSKIKAMRIPSILPLLFLPVLLPAQEREYLGDDLPFFQKKAELYQHWMETKGLGGLLAVDKVRLQKDGRELELFLRLGTSDPDIAAALWEELENGFAEQNPEQTLYDALFHTFARMMEIPPSQGNVQVYIPNEKGAGYSPCFLVWIWQDGGKIEKIREIQNCKSQPLEIPVRLPQAVRVVSNDASVNVAGAGNADVFDRILAYARNRYEREVCEARFPEVEVERRTDHTLVFTVSDLCREVLTEERRSLWCLAVERWWGPCNDMRRERLEFTIHYIPTAEGYLLSGSLTGKFGSGVYRPRKSGWMDMEPDFEEDFLQPYVRRFQKDLKNYLEEKD